MSREFSKVYASLWGSEKLGKLKAPKTLDPRVLYFYLVSNPHSNSSGCYDLKQGYAMTDLKCSEIDFRKGIEDLCKVGLIEMETGYHTILITNWVKHNEPTNSKHAIGILAQLQAATSPTLKSRRANEFLEYSEAKGQLEDKQMGAILSEKFKHFGKGIDIPRPRPDLDRDQDRDQDPEGKTPPAAAVEELPDDDLPEFVKAEWNKLAEKFDNTEIRQLNDARRKSIRARSIDVRRFLRKHHGQDPDFRECWTQIMLVIEKSPHLVGGSGANWHCDFDWILQPKNLLKIMEGKYLEKRSNGKTGDAAVSDALRDWVSRRNQELGIGSTG